MLRYSSSPSPLKRSSFPSYGLTKHKATLPRHKRTLTTITKGTEPQIHNGSKLVWLDLEMTGLNVTKDTILEAACVITDPNLNILAEGPDIVINHTEKQLEEMGEWCQINHAKNGLISKVKESNLTLSQAESQLSSFISSYVDYNNVGYLTGNSVYVDRMFLAKYMPNTLKPLSHRLIDVSSIALVCSKWYPSQYKKVKYSKKSKHRALDDIHESIDELRSLKQHFFDINPLSLVEPENENNNNNNNNNLNQHIKQTDTENTINNNTNQVKQ